jgi:phosphoglycerate dehydrogenase-like enzyme
LSLPIRISVLPTRQAEYEAAIVAGGGVCESIVEAATGLVWTDSQGVTQLAQILADNPAITWVQLPFAGTDNFIPLFDSILTSGRHVTFTSAKGAYREPVAEHALMLALALARAIPERIVARSWGRKFAVSMFDANVVIVGGGGIASELIRLLTPFRPHIAVVRREIQNMDGVDFVTALDGLDALLPQADFVFCASALTKETRGLFNEQRFMRMKRTSYFINIARGSLVVTADLEAALRKSVIAGAGIDVTDPEPLPTGNSLWDAPNIIITPHTADTPEICVRLLSGRIMKNVSNLLENLPLDGQVNLKLGY